jgi:CubicO group peptidase (beta-lactamase class C family)
MAEWYCYPNRTLAEQIAIDRDMGKRGCTPVSLSLHEQRSGDTSFPRYTTVWHRRPGDAVKHEFLPLAKRSEVRPWLEERESKGMYARLIDALGVAEQDRRFSLIATPGPVTEIDAQAIVRVSMTTIRDVRYKRRWFPAWASIHGVNSEKPHDMRMSFVWEKQPDDRFYYWNLLLDDEAAYAEAAAARRAGFAWPHLSSITNGTETRPRQRLSVWRDDEIEGLHEVSSVPVAKLDATINGIARDGLWLLSLQGTDYGPGQVFDLVIGRAGHWREKARHLVRRYAGQSLRPPKGEARPTGGVRVDVGRPVRVGSGGQEESFPVGRPERMGTTEMGQPDDAALITGGPFREVDAYVVNLMTTRSIRAGQIAIAREGRLVHAAAFTWADPDYPVTKVETQFRLGSVAKVVTSIALMRFAEETVYRFDLFDARNHSLAALLGIEHAGWSSRSAAHLLTHTAYFRDGELGITWDSLTIANALRRSKLAVKREGGLEFLRKWAPDDGAGYFADDASPPDLPDDRRAVGRYSNFGFERAADIITALSGESYEDWTRTRVFKPLLLHRPRRGVRFVADATRSDVEVRYHPSRPTDAWNQHESKGSRGNLQYTKRAPLQYEGTNLDLGLGAGAWSWAAVDCARLISSLGGPRSPVSDHAAEQLLETKFAKNRTLGFFVTTFDSDKGAGSGPRRIRRQVCHHNGGAPGVAALALRRDDNLVVVLAFNTDLLGGLHARPHGRDLLPLLDRIPEEDWPATDLFDDV